MPEATQLGLLTPSHSFRWRKHWDHSQAVHNLGTLSSCPLGLTGLSQVSSSLSSWVHSKDNGHFMKSGRGQGDIFFSNFFLLETVSRYVGQTELIVIPLPQHLKSWDY